MRRFGARSRAVRRFTRNRAAMAALIFVVFLLLIAIFGTLIAPSSPDAQTLTAHNDGPSGAHLLGADAYGRDVLSRLIYAVRVTFSASAIALGVAVLLGIPLGLLCGLRRGALDLVLSRVIDALLSLPPLILALAIVGAAGPGLTHAMIAVGIVMSPRFFRVARAAAASVSQETFVEAARADGSSAAWIMVRHVLPNASGALLVQASFSLGFIITAEASLSYLGLGVQPPQASWGAMLKDAFQQVYESTFQVFPPAIMIILTVFAFAVLGDGLRDSFGRDEGTE